MKKIFFCTIFFVSLYWAFVVAPANQVITYFWGGGRFGDKIISYTTAKWIAIKYNMPLLLKPFQYASMLQLGREEQEYTKEVRNQYEKVIPITNESDIIKHRQENVIFESRGGAFYINRCNDVSKIMAYMLQDKHFAAEIKRLVKPIVPLSTIPLPQDKITVAVHVRKGGGFDPRLASIQYFKSNVIKRRFFYADKRWPSKFPPEQYYVDQIKRISELYCNEPLFVYIFTDDRNPASLMARIKRAVNKPNINFYCRRQGNAHNRHVVEDFYNMSRFDCLIRSCSNFAIAAQILGNHQLIIYPKHWRWIGRKLVIDQVFTIDNRGI